MTVVAMELERAGTGGRGLFSSRAWGVVLLCLFWAAAYLPELGVRGLRLEEGRRATPAWEMMLRQDYVVPRIYGEVYLNKPPLYFWLVAGVGKILGDVNEWAVRIPSAAGALLGALLLLGFSPKTLRWRTRLLAAWAYLSCISLLDKGTLGEIDALLSALVIGAVLCWWNGAEKKAAETGGNWKGTLGGWMGAGMWMAAAVLLKGPGGPLEFYGMVIPFVLWRRGIKGVLGEFISVRHLVFAVLAAFPTAIWVYFVIRSGVLSPRALADIWANQLGLDNIFGHFGGAASGPPALAGESLQWRRYWLFVPQVVGNTLPWAIWGAAAMIAPYARKIDLLRENSRPLWQFLVGGTLTLVGVFWLYPGADARHILAVAMPVCVLAAMVSSRSRPPETAEREREMLGFFMAVAAGVPAVAGVGVLAAAAIFFRPLVGVAAVTAAACIAGSAVLFYIRRGAAAEDYAGAAGGSPCRRDPAGTRRGGGGVLTGESAERHYEPGAGSV